MPIGASKVGALGGLVPGGSETFNAPGTFSVPPGVKKVSITGVGGVGNPGNAGNQGNPGNPGTGGAGGGGGGGRATPNNFSFALRTWGGRSGGHAWISMNNPGNPFITPTPAPSRPTVLKIGGSGGSGGNACPGNAGAPGAAGNAGTAGNPGNPGNSGQQSSGLGNTFCGGAGGNAGAGGAAGNAGQSGGGGGAGNGATTNNTIGNGGSGGCGGGSGGYGGNTSGICSSFASGAAQGGGGAGTVNSGQSGQTGAVLFSNSNNPLRIVRAGGTGNFSAPVLCPLPYVSLSPNTDGGYGGSSDPNTYFGTPSVIAVRSCRCAALNVSNPFNPGNFTNRLNVGQFSPGCAPNLIVRAGAGGGSSDYGAGCAVPTYGFRGGGGGGGGGRGNLGNSSGPTPTPTGSAGTPATFNCVSVTPGSPYPIVVGAPGGQVVISWNPQ